MRRVQLDEDPATDGAEGSEAVRRRQTVVDAPSSPKLERPEPEGRDGPLHEVTAAGGSREESIVAMLTSSTEASSSSSWTWLPPVPLDQGWHGWLNHRHRLTDDARKSCPAALRSLEQEYQWHARHIDRSPKYNQPWYYYNPHPLCGVYLLRHVQPTPQRQSAPTSAHSGDDGRFMFAFALRTRRNALGMSPSDPTWLAVADKVLPSSLFVKIKAETVGQRPSAPVAASLDGMPAALAGSPDAESHITRLPAAPPSSVWQLHRLPYGINSSTVSPELREGGDVVLAMAGVPSTAQIRVDNCGSFTDPFRNAWDAEGGKALRKTFPYGGDVLLTARLVSEHGFQSARVVPHHHHRRGGGAAIPTDAPREEDVGSKTARAVQGASLGGSPWYDVTFTAHEEGMYALEVKAVHVNGSSNDPKMPKSLGVVGIRAADDANRKTFMYNDVCDDQRHVVGSPLIVVVLPRATTRRTDPGGLAAIPPDQNAIQARLPPLCRRADHADGRWVRASTVAMNCRAGSPYCLGDPRWLTDASAYNTDMVWAPPDCRFRLFNPPSGPTASCLRHGGGGPPGALLLVGDSVTREYAKNCALFHLRGAQLVCVFANIALEGQHYSRDYAAAVADAILDNLIQHNAAVFVTNLGIHHMIGPCTTEQWREFVGLFVQRWHARIRFHSGRSVSDEGVASMRLEQEGGENVSHGKRESRHRRSEEPSPPHTTEDSPPALRSSQTDEFKPSRGGSGGRPALLTYAPGQRPRLEKAVWTSPPTIHYARKGMGAQRAREWDRIAWAALQPLGFRRLDALAVTASRQEGTWDGLHYASERNKRQTAHRNRDVRPATWNGGVANMLFTMLLNIICDG